MTDATLNDLHAELSKSGAQQPLAERENSGRGNTFNTSDPTDGVQQSGHGIIALMKRHETLVKYFVIGCTASAIDVLLFLILYNVVGTSALVAHSISVPTSVLFSFFVNTRHNFKTNDYLALRLASFVIVCGIGYVAGYGVIYAAQAMGLDANAGKILSLPFVFVVQYILNSRITFRKFEAAA
ncbi:GtrA family protein [Ruegeria atlantica]|uniref:GtrA-like protein n=1 Tax=Ruegeria atlantica TaxID=81569 RepID=A0A0P1E5S4_9RHOB|nr:GtrA family protein [Ruegeria atlantica]CUH42779.1 GtrA-like protein [Ruegeria atlantica]